MATQAADFSPVRFSTEHLPPRHRISFWRDFFGPHVFGGDIEPARKVPFRADVTARMLPGFKLVSAESSPARYTRSRPFLADGRDSIGLHVSASVGRVCHRGREIDCSRGDAVPLDAAETGAVVSPSTARFRHLWFPRADLTPLVASLDDALSRPIAPNSETMQHLLGYVRFLEEQQRFADAGLARNAAVHVRDLFALVLGVTRDAAVVAEGRGLRAARMQSIKSYIHDNLSDGALTVGGVAARHRITPRYIQLLFESEGTTFSEFVLNQRLARVHRMLSDPRYVGSTVSAIALEAGFGDVSYFNRRFRRRYGVSPSDVRHGNGNR
jgi:AraC-like DNA-binding protein